MVKVNRASRNKNKASKPKAKVVPMYNCPTMPAIRGGGIAQRMPKATQSIYSMPQGSVVVKDNEYWYGVEGQSPANIQSVTFQPGASGLQRLDQIASTYELYRVRKLSIHYYTNTGFNTSGMIHCGVDFDPSDRATTVAGISMLRPGFRGPIYLTKETIVVDVDRINRSRWMYCKAGPADNGNLSKGFLLATAATTSAGPAPTPVGEIYCEYEIELSGPVTPTEVFDSSAGTVSAVVDIVATTGAIDGGVSEERLLSKTGAITEPVGAPYYFKNDISNPVGWTTADWLEMDQQLNGEPNTVYNITTEVCSVTNAPNITGIYQDVTNGTVLKTGSNAQTGVRGTVSTFIAQVLTDALGKFVGALKVSCDHFPGTATAVFCKAVVASFGASPLIAQYYEHME